MLDIASITSLFSLITNHIKLSWSAETIQFNLTPNTNVLVDLSNADVKLTSGDVVETESFTAIKSAIEWLENEIAILKKEIGL